MEWGKKKSGENTLRKIEFHAYLFENIRLKIYQVNLPDIRLR